MTAQFVFLRFALLATFSEANIFGMHPSDTLKVKQKPRKARSQPTKIKTAVGFDFEKFEDLNSEGPVSFDLREEKTVFDEPVDELHAFTDRKTNRIVKKAFSQKNHTSKPRFANQGSCQIIRDRDLQASIPVEFYLEIFGSVRSSVVMKDVGGYFVAENLLEKLVTCDCYDRSRLIDLKNNARVGVERVKHEDVGVFERNIQAENHRVLLKKQRKIEEYRLYMTIAKTLKKCLYHEIRGMGLGAELFSKLMDNARHCIVYKHMDGLNNKSYFPMGVMD